VSLYYANSPNFGGLPGLEPLTFSLTFYFLALMPQ
jgi:hypothetical protein